MVSERKRGKLETAKEQPVLAIISTGWRWRRNSTPKESGMEQQPPEQTPTEREAEEFWVEDQYRKHCPWSIRLAKWIIRIIRSVATGKDLY
jgi:hypothetical protein